MHKQKTATVGKPPISTNTNTDTTKGWRNVIPIHPAATLFPRMPQPELVELAEDIKKRGGLTTAVALYTDTDNFTSLLDGINRLDALELAGFRIVKDGELDRDVVDCHGIPGNVDPYDYVISANAHRRHLTGEQKRERIAKLIAAKLNQSNRTIAKQTKVDHKTVAKVRAQQEARGEIPHAETRTDSKGRKQPAKKPKPVINGVATMAKTETVEPVAPQQQETKPEPPKVASQNKNLNSHSPQGFIVTSMNSFVYATSKPIGRH
jgi:hypothetical protein